ncbi:unnamed protein product [Dicrocoelium dendriticum]|nr:unnamed protein product [Dicrocoelium dendriticum]
MGDAGGGPSSPHPRLRPSSFIKCKVYPNVAHTFHTGSAKEIRHRPQFSTASCNGIIDIPRSAQYTDCCREVGCRNTSDKSKTLHRFNTLPRTSQGHTNRGVWNDSLSTEQLATMYRREPPPLFTTHPQASLTEHTLPTSHNSGDCCLSKQINLMRDPVLVRHCNHWPLGDQITCGQISVRGSTVDKGVRQEAVHSSETTDHMAQTVENLVDHQTSATAEVLETRLQQLYERRKRMLSQLSDEERKLHRLLCEEMVLTGIGPQSNTHLARGINAGAGDTLSDGSAHSTKTTSDAVRSSCLISKLKWRNSRRSKSAHERVEDGNTVHRALDTQATQPHYFVPNSLTCCGGDCSWVQSAPQNAVIGNAYAGMVSTGTIKTSHQKSDFGNRLHQQLPLSGTQTATARWKAMQCEATTNLCNPLRSDSYQPPIPTKVREWTLQKDVNNGRIIDLRFADLHRYQEEIQPNILAQLRMVKADTGQNGAKTSNKTYHVTNHNRLLFDAALHSVKPRGILISPSRSNLAGTDVSQNVKTHPHGTIISNGQCAQSPLKGSADVNGYGDDAMKYFRVRLDQHKPM